MKGRTKMRWGLALLPVIAAVGIWAMSPTSMEVEPAQAADHTDPPDRVGTPGDAADIGDIYAWHTGMGADQVLNVVITFAGPLAPVMDQKGNYDPDVLYGIYLDNTGDSVADTDIYVRFGQNANDEWGVQVTNLPGEAGPVIGPVETEIDAPNGGKVWAGLRDDPFFMDLQGFQDTLANDTLSFDSSRDFFAGGNITAVVLQMPMSAALGAGSTVNVWTTSARFN